MPKETLEQRIARIQAETNGGATTTAPQGQPTPEGQGILAGLGLGAVKGVADLVRGTGEVLQGAGQRAMALPALVPGGDTYSERLAEVKATTAQRPWQKALDTETPEGQKVQDWLKAKTLSEGIAKGAVNIGSFALPASKISALAKMSKAYTVGGNTTKAARFGGEVLRRGIEGAGSAGITTLQEGDTDNAGISALFGAILPGGTKSLSFVSRSTPDLERALDKTYRAIKPRLIAGRELSQIRTKMDTANKIIVASGYKPESLQDYVNAILGAKKRVWGEVDSKIAGGVQDKLTVDLKPIADSIKAMASNPSYKRVAGGDIDRLDAIADALTSEGNRIPLPEAEVIKQFINEELEGTFGQSNLSNLVIQAKRLITKGIGEQENSLLSSIPDDKEFHTLKKAWGALSEIQPDVIKREVVFSRQNPVSLVEGLGAIEGVGNILTGLIQPSGIGPGQAVGGLMQLFTGTLAKRANDSDLLVRDAFDIIAREWKETLAKDAGKRTIMQSIPYNRTMNEPLLRSSIIQSLLGTYGK